jgi:hypothetical protein
MKLYKVAPSNGIVASVSAPVVQQQQPVIQNGSTPKHPVNTTLLQQTLTNQHVTNNNVTAAKLNTQVTTQMNGKPSVKQEDCLIPRS